MDNAKGWKQNLGFSDGFRPTDDRGKAAKKASVKRWLKVKKSPSEKNSDSKEFTMSRLHHDTSTLLVEPFSPIKNCRDLGYAVCVPGNV